MFGRLLQGISGGLIGVVIPLYLAECLGASNRGRGTAIFQWLLTLGIMAAALIAMYFSYQVDAVKAQNDPGKLLTFQDHAWRGIFWVSLAPGILFVLGSFLVAESPRWLFRRGRKEAALAALLRSRSEEQAQLELQEMEATIAAEQAKGSAPGDRVKESLLHRKYVIPLVLACIILACNQATGVNSVIGYNPCILFQAGLSDLQSHWGYVLLDAAQFHSGDHFRGDAGGQTGPQMVALDWQWRNHCFVDLRRAAFSPRGIITRGCEGRAAGPGQHRSESVFGF